MVVKIKKSIKDAKNKKGFTSRQQGRHKKKIKAREAEKNRFVDKRKLREQKMGIDRDKKDQQDADLEMNSSDEEFEKEMERHKELDAEEIDETVFDQVEHGELDLPDYDESESADEDPDVDLGEDSDLDEYYRELGIDPKEMVDEKKQNAKQKKEDALYEKRQKVRSQRKEAAREREEVLSGMMNKARDSPNYRTLSRIIQVVRQVFGEKEQDKREKAQDEEMEEENKKTKEPVFSKALNSSEYLTLLQFFTTELPTLILKFAEIQLPAIDKVIGFQKNNYFKSEKKRAHDISQHLSKLQSKQSILMKSFSANFNRLLQQAINENETSAIFIGHFFGNGPEVAKCVLPFPTYRKKLANNCSKICMNYSSMDKSAIVLSFSCLRTLLVYAQNATLYESSLKRMYNEFARISKSGGGGFSVQDKLRMCQNCFVELLSLDRSIGYQLGFSYIRQLCMHLRTLRNNMTKDSLKNIYSWQFYNCIKLWVLALTTAGQSDLVLLVHPLVQLIVGVIRLSNNMKYFPFHLKAFELLTLINKKTGQFVPAAQYMLYPFDTTNQRYFNAKSKPLQEKTIPDSLISLKIAKKHLDTQEIKDRIVKEALEALTLYFGSNSGCLAFPEIIVPIGVMLRKFKKGVNNNQYRKSVQTFLDQLKRNEDFVADQRAKIQDKSLRDPAKLHQQFALMVNHDETPLGRECVKIDTRRQEAIVRKLEAFK